jgi:hypothetical protein
MDCQPAVLSQDSVVEIFTGDLIEAILVRAVTVDALLPRRGTRHHIPGRHMSALGRMRPWCPKRLAFGYTIRAPHGMDVWIVVSATEDQEIGNVPTLHAALEFVQHVSVGMVAPAQASLIQPARSVGRQHVLAP